MIDMVVLVLVLCFVVGIVSSALFLASFFLYRESQRCDDPVRSEVVSTQPKDAPTAAPAGASQLEVETDRRAVSTSAVKRRGERASDANSGDGDGDGGGGGGGGGNSETSSNCSYMCEVCGSCCAGDRRPLDELQPGQGEGVKQTPPAYPCGELFVSSVDVGFKCQAGTDSGGKPRGAFFFFRGRQPSKLLEPVAPSKGYLTMAALPSVPYHLWFCHGQQHSAKSLRCPDCRPVFSFELCDSEILFHLSQKRLRRCAWLLAYEETSGSSRVIYRGDVRSLTKLQYTGKLFVYFGLPSEADELLPEKLPCAGPMKHHVCSGLLNEDSTHLDKDTDKLAQGDLMAAPTATPEDPPDRLNRQRLRRRRFGVGSGNDESLDLNGNADDAKLDSDTNDSNCTGANLKNDIVKEPTPLSMGSMRNAARWPITQFENLIESSSSEAAFPAATADTEMEPPLSPSPMSPVPQRDESNIDASMTTDVDQFSIRLENYEED